MPLFEGKQDMTDKPKLDLALLREQMDQFVEITVNQDAKWPAQVVIQDVGQVLDIVWCGDKDNAHLLKLAVNGEPTYYDLHASGIVIVDYPRRQRVLFDSRTPDTKKEGRP